MTANLVCRSFLARLPLEKKEELFAHLSPILRDIFDEYSQLVGEPTSGFPSTSASLHRVHFSWLLPYLRTFAKQELHLIATVLSDTQKTGIAKVLKAELKTCALTDVAREYFTTFLWERLIEDEGDLPPVNCLLSTPLDPFLSFPFSELIATIDLLGLHDLTIELPKVIDTNLRRTIVESLSPLQRSYLPQLLEAKEEISFAPLELSLWNHDANALRKALHQRGLNRFAKAMVVLDRGWQWHLTHLLDTGRAQIIEKLKPRASESMSQTLFAQLITACRFVESHRRQP